MLCGQMNPFVFLCLSIGHLSAVRLGEVALDCVSWINLVGD